MQHFVINSYILKRKQYSSAGWCIERGQHCKKFGKKAAGEKVDEYKKEEGISQEAQKYGSTTQFNSNEC